MSASCAILPGRNSLVNFTRVIYAVRQTLARYVGRLHRQHAGKTDALVVDYMDAATPVLTRMAAKGRAGYRALDYSFE
jgi:hypothetical protein